MQRLYIFTPPGSNDFGPYASVCGSLPNGCYNTGAFDETAPPGSGCLNPDSKQFADMGSLIAYAASRGESLRQAFSIQEVNAICSGSSPLVPTNQNPVPNPGGGTSIGCVGCPQPGTATSYPTNVPTQVPGAGNNTSPGGAGPGAGGAGFNPFNPLGGGTTSAAPGDSGFSFESIKAFLLTPLGWLLIAVIVLWALTRGGK